MRAEVTELYRLGGAAAPEWATLVDVRDVAFGGEGELWVVDTRGRQILRVSADGQSAENVLRRGGGPGEFQAPSGLAVLPDGRILVGDIVNRNLQLLDGEGRLVAGARGSGFLRSADVEWLEGNDFIAVPSVFFVDGEARVNTANGSEVVESLPLLRFTLDRDLSVRIIGHASYTQPPRSTGRYASHAFQPGVHWAVHGGRIALVEGVAYQIRVLDGAGRPLGTIGRSLAPRRPTRADVAAARAEARSRLIGPDGIPQVAGAVGAGSASGVRDARAVLKQIEDGLDAMTFNDRIPVILDIRYDAEGRLWVARTPDVWGESPLLDVFAPDGAYLGTTRALPRLPDAFGPGGLAAFIEKDDLDVPYLRVVRIAF
jgi:hypothetical protein